MSANSPCTCGRRRGDLADLVVTALKGNASAFNGYHWTPSDWSAVRCIRPWCTGFWRTKASYVFELPDCTRDYDKLVRLKREAAEKFDLRSQRAAEGGMV